MQLLQEVMREKRISEKDRRFFFLINIENKTN